MVFPRKNGNWSLYLCLNVLIVFGFLVPGKFTGIKKVLLKAYCLFCYIYIMGLYIIIQTGDLLVIWGDVPLMVSTSFLLFTNLALGVKLTNCVLKEKAIQTLIEDGNDELTAENRVEGIQIVKNCDKETSLHMHLYIFLSVVTVFGWAASAEKNSLPLRAWYPYDTSKSPAYVLTYFQQVTGLWTSAALNISLDTVITSLIAISRCRLRLLNLSLRNLCSDIPEREGHGLPTPDEDKEVISQLTVIVRKHQTALKSVSEVQRCFSEPILAQLSVSMVIICVSAYQLSVELNSSSKNMVHLVSMVAYLVVMNLQLFTYCYQGNQLSVENSELPSAAYECLWYIRSLRFRRALLMVMTRAERVVELRAGGLYTLSIASYTAVIKASYTFFTVLQRVEDRQK